MIYRLCPTLIREGYVYIAETPLFEITCGEKTWFAYTDKEKNDIVKDLEGKRYKVDRSKGLGQNDPEMMWLTTMNPETRRLIKVMPEDARPPRARLICCSVTICRGARITLPKTATNTSK